MDLRADRPCVTAPQRRRPAWIVLVGLVAALALLAAACGDGGNGNGSGGDVDAGQDDPTPSDSDTKQLTVAMTADLLTLYPIDETVVGTDVFGHIFDSLVVIGVDGELEPRLATEWETEDSLTWEFSLHEDATWHDGEPVTAADVAYTFNHIVENEDLATHGYVRMVSEAEAVDDHTVRFTLNEPVAAFDRWTSLIHIVPEGTAEEMTPEEFTADPIGSGPYQVEELVGGERLVLSAYEDYRDGPPAIDELVFRSVPSESARLSGLRTGELDVISDVPPPEVAGLESAEGIEVIAQPNNRVIYLGFNVELPPVDDVRVREAINVAIDREAITSEVLEGLGDPIGQVAAPVTFGYSDDPRFDPAPFDPDQAAALLEEAGYAGEEIVLTYPTSDLPFAAPVAEAVGGFLSSVGLNIQLEAVEWGTMIERWRSRDFQHIHLFGYGPSILDANLIINSLYETGSRGYYQTEELDDLAARQAGENDRDERLSIIEEIWAIDQDNLLNAWLYNEYDAYAVREGVQWEPRPSRRMYFWDADITG